MKKLPLIIIAAEAVIIVFQAVELRLANQSISELLTASRIQESALAHAQAVRLNPAPAAPSVTNK